MAGPTLTKPKIIGTLRRSNPDRNAVILAFGMKRPARSFRKSAERDVKTTKSLGPAYLLDSVGNEIQLRKKLSDSFGADGDLILAIAMSKLLNQTSLKNLHHVLEDSFLPEMYSLKESFSSQWLSSFLERLSTEGTL